MVKFEVLENRDEWLKARSGRLGGSDAACLLGLNPWKSNVELWREKRHPKTVEEIDNPAMKYGRDAEPIVRQLFTLDHPEFEVMYQENNIWSNDDYPFAHASLDGWLVDQNGNFGVLEIKTATIRNRAQAVEWNGQIPQNYYCQLLWYMMVTNAQYARLVALIQNAGRQEVRTYEVDRDEDEINLLADAGAKFWESLQKGEEPALILPDV